MESEIIDVIKLIDDVPSDIKGRVALAGGVLHISSELKGRLDMVSLFANLRRRGVYDYEFHGKRGLIPVAFMFGAKRLQMKLMLFENFILAR